MGNVTAKTSGEIASFMTPAETNIKSLKVHFSPKQDLHGYSKPWVAGSGKNLCPDLAHMTSTMPYPNIIYEYNPDTYTWKIIDDIGGNTQTWRQARFFFDASAMAGKRVCLSYQSFTRHFGDVDSQVGMSSISFVAGGASVWVSPDQNKKWIDVPSDVDLTNAEIGFRLAQENGGLLGKGAYIEVVGLQIEVGDTGTNFEPYENICPIEGWDGVEVNKCHENLVLESSIINNCYVRGAITATGTEIGSVSNTNGYKTTDFIKVLPNTIYTISFYWINAAAAGLAFYSDADVKSVISGVSMEQMKSSPYTFTTPSNCKYIRFCSRYLDSFMGLVRGANTLTDEDYDGNIISYQWKLPDEYQEVEYIESTGTQHIDTLINLLSNDFKIECKFELLSNKNVEQPLFSIWTSTYQYWNCFVRQNSYNNAIDVYTGSHHSFGSVALNDVKSVFLQRISNTWSLTYDGTNIEWNYTPTKINDITLKLFKRGDLNSSSSIRIYNFKLDINNIESLNLIPCYRKSDNEIGMYDTISQTFYTNQGTGTFLKGNDVNKTFYGGYIDLISGELVEEWVGAKKKLSEASNVVQYDGVIGYQFDNTPSYGQIINNNKQKCNVTTYSWHSATEMPQNHFYAYYTTASNLFNRLLLFLENNHGLSNDTEISYVAQLATPITHQLTPTQLQSFIGQNNFWSNADYVEVEYDLIETEDIQKCRKKIILNQPHIESQIGSNSSTQVTHFKTNMKAPLKECKIYFTPVQTGSGDPSPTNIRPITGWTNIILNHSGVNMLQCDSPDYYMNNVGTEDGIASVLSRNPSGEVESISFNGISTSTNVFRNLNYTPSSPSEITIPNGQIALTGYSNQIYVVPMSNRNGLSTIEGKSYWNVYESADYWGIWNVNSANDYGGLWARTQLLPMSKDINVDATVYPMMCLMEDKGCEFEAYKGSKYNIDWTNDVGTVHGGYIDLVKGELVQNYAEKIFIGSSDENWSYYDTTTTQGLNRHIFHTTCLDRIIKNDSLETVFSDRSVQIYEATSNNPVAFYVGTPIQQVYFAIDASLCDPTVESFSNWLSNNNIDFIYELAEPIHYSLTSQQLLSFKGINNIWANTNEQTEVKFWTY